MLNFNFFPDQFNRVEILASEFSSTFSRKRFASVTIDSKECWCTRVAISCCAGCFPMYPTTPAHFVSTRSHWPRHHFHFGNFCQFQQIIFGLLRFDKFFSCTLNDHSLAYDIWRKIFPGSIHKNSNYFDQQSHGKPCEKFLWLFYHAIVASRYPQGSLDVRTLI